MTPCENSDWEVQRFNWPDYAVFATTLSVSLAIGIFHGFFAGGKQRTTAEFLMGNRKMNFFTLGASLTVGFTSAIALLGNVSEMYNYGTQYTLVLLSFIIIVIPTSRLFLPVFRDLTLTSIYEYVEMRYSNGTRLLLSALYTVQMLMYVSVVVYAPALALRQVTGIDTMNAVAIIFIVCIFYTSLGGIKAVVWSDTFQAVIILAALIAVLIRGCIVDGGPAHVWHLSYQSERLEFFNFNPDPRVRHSVFSVVIGSTFYWLSMNAATQTSVQRLLAVSTLKEATWAIWMSCIGMIIIYSTTFYLGLLVYAHFQHCDPLLSKAVDATDQLLPLYVLQVAGTMPGIPGLFVAGVFSASLSTVASSLNAIAASFLRDLLGGGFGYHPAEARAAIISRLLSATFGLLCFAFVFFVQHLGGVLQAAITLNGMLCGIALGVFTLGMYVPWSNTKGTITGVIVALSLVLWLSIGAQIAVMDRRLVHIRKPVGLNCTCDIILPLNVSNDEIFDGYRLSYFWYSPLGWILTVIVGTAVSVITGPTNINSINPALLAPIIRPKRLSRIEKSSRSSYTESTVTETTHRL